MKRSIDIASSVDNKEETKLPNGGAEIEEMNIPELKLGIPKGSLQESTIRLFRRAGYDVRLNGRSYSLEIDDNCLGGMLIRPQEIPIYLERGVLDAGLTGQDWLREVQADVVEVASLRYARQNNGTVKWVVAVNEDSDIGSVSDLNGKVVYTELVNVAKKYLSEKGIKATVIFSHGVTEAKIPHLADAIVELTETGCSLRENNLRIIDTVMHSETVFVANRNSWMDVLKREKIENIAMLLKGALMAESKVELRMRVPKADLEKVLMILSETDTVIYHLADPKVCMIDVLVDRLATRDIIPQLKRAGAEKIIRYTIDNVVL